ncbi:hypothetical protein [uncultured Luteimonas sp.]|uniref:hypothetical protein n=1 Tax=uncultured Luteimonas sp. TaxID=453144 RepID=UPI002631AAE4|nr:hypothetical protein [uncultured Luteimonas sp.]
MSSFPSLHDALSSLLPGARGGPEWLMRAGMLGAGGDVVDIDDRRGDPARGHGPHDVDVDLDAVPRPTHPADGGNGSVRHGHSGTDIPAHARQAMSDALRGPAPQPLAPPQGQRPLEPSLHALARELQALPPSVIRQLSDALHSHPEALRALPAQPEALAAVLARATPDTTPAPHAAAAEARRLVHGGEGAHPVPRGQDADAPREARQAVPPGVASDPRAAGETRPGLPGQDLRPGMPPAESRQGQPAEARPAWAAGMDPALAAGLRGQGAGAEAPTPAAAQSRADALATPQPSFAPAGSTSATPTTATTATPLPAGSTQAPAAPGPLAQDVPSLQAARADAAGTTVERGGQGPGLSGLGGVAAGVTLAAVANPAGTTHAHAPDSAVRARGAQKGRDHQRDDPAHEGGNGRQARGRKAGTESDSGAQRDRAASAASAAAASVATVGQSPGTGAATAGSVDADSAADAGTDPRHPAGASHSPPQQGATAAGHTVESGPAGRPLADATATAAAAREPLDPEARQSRQRQWLYWSLIAVTYACLGVALATVAPDLSGLPIAPESLGTWRNVLTGAGLLTGLWAWLLARRMR